MTRPADTPWVKARKSGGTGDCVQLRRRGGMIEIRDTKAGDGGPVLRLTAAEFAAFLDGARRTDFDHLLPT